MRAVCSLHEIAHELGMPTLAIGIPPSAYQAMQPEAAELAIMVNRDLRAWSSQDSRVLCEYIDHPITTWSKGDGRWAPDGLHLSPEGYRAVGEGLAPIVSRCLGLS